jgi:hypothetical protein
VPYDGYQDTGFVVAGVVSGGGDLVKTFVLVDGMHDVFVVSNNKQIRIGRHTVQTLVAGSNPRRVHLCLEECSRLQIWSVTARHL